MKKMVLLLIFVFYISLICCACQNPILYQRKPCYQKSSKWASEDGSIVFTVDDVNAYATGKMVIEDNEIDFFLTTDMGLGMYLYSINVLNTMIETPEEEYEYWHCSYKSKNKFVATVKKTTFFDIGDTIEFNKVTDDTSLSN